MKLSPWSPIPRDSRHVPEWAGVGLLVHATLERIGRDRLGVPRAHRKSVSLDELARTLGHVATVHGAATKARVDEALAILCRTSSPDAPHLQWADAVGVEVSRSIYLPTGEQVVTRWDRVDVRYHGNVWDGRGSGIDVHVIDWKTAEPLVDESRMADDPQVARYLLGARSVYPFAREHRVSFVWLGSDEVHSVTWRAEIDERVRFAAVSDRLT